MLLMIDNYDSFTYNLVQYLGELGAEVQVVRNDEITRGRGRGARALAHRHLAGPVHAERGRHHASTLIERLAGRVPILGVCLGHQAIGQAFGGKVVRAKQVMHGKISRIRHDGQGRFRETPRPTSSPRATTRWWSSAPACPPASRSRAESEDGEIMGLRHRSLPVEGVQFHPEALLTEHGHEMLENFI